MKWFNLLAFEYDVHIVLFIKATHRVFMVITSALIQVHLFLRNDITQIVRHSFSVSEVMYISSENTSLVCLWLFSKLSQSKLHSNWKIVLRYEYVCVFSYVFLSSFLFNSVSSQNRKSPAEIPDAYIITLTSYSLECFVFVFCLLFCTHTGIGNDWNEIHNVLLLMSGVCVCFFQMDHWNWKRNGTIRFI